jgi:hypothetical protein
MLWDYSGFRRLGEEGRGGVREPEFIPAPREPIMAALKNLTQGFPELFSEISRLWIIFLIIISKEEHLLI